MQFGTYLFALFLPPIYLFTRGRILSGFLTAFLCGIALLLVLTIFLAPVSAILWLIASMVGLFEARRQFFHEHAEMLATKMAEKMRAPQPPSLPPVIISK